MEFIYLGISFLGSVEEAVVRSLNVHKQLASLGEDRVVYISRIHQAGSHPPSTQKSMYDLPVIIVFSIGIWKSVVYFIHKLGLLLWERMCV